MQVGRVKEDTTNAGSGAEGSLTAALESRRRTSGQSVASNNATIVVVKAILHESAFHKKAKGKGIFLAKDPRWGN